ncbi:MAG: electron transport complex subunit RsxC [Bacillota bacterium]|nr:electron transport complex subunit RsxC [Bacillota bacterium]
MDYIKYALKDNEELVKLLEGKDNLFVVSCNKCFKEFNTLEEPELMQFVELAKANGKTVTGFIAVDFVCNRVQTEKALKDVIPAGTENVICLACGLGIQTVADMEELPVYSGTDSLNYIGYHGMALTKKTCDACNQCFLNITGGICPIVDCTKSLVNGQCGGAKNGKCEIDPAKDCAWEKINTKLKQQGRLEEFLKEPVELRDYSKVNFKTVNEFVKSIRENRFAGFYGGVHPEERKEFTEHCAIERFPEPKEVVIPTSMSSGKSATPIVNVGDTVKVGQKIAEASAFISCNVHSSVSGTVKAIEDRLHPVTGMMLPAIVIESDGKFTVDESVKPAKSLDELTPEEIVEIVKEKGIAGMGGATFPTYVKLNPGKPIDAVLINGSECEPLITADHRVLLEYADDIIFGLKAIMKAVSAPKGIIVIEDNKPDAIELLTKKLEGVDNIEVVAAKTKYPQGAEKMLIKRALGKSVPSGGLPADAGAVVSNVSSAKAISDAIQTGMPLIERVVTVSGENMAKPGNYMVRIGTNVADVIAHCGGIKGDDVTIKLGGFMMGVPITDTNTSVVKGTNGIIAYETDHTVAVECIKCGRCADVCPMELKPLYFAKFSDANDAKSLKEYNLMDCMECGCCQYICSSKIPLVSKIKAGKKLVREMK